MRTVLVCTPDPEFAARLSSAMTRSRIGLIACESVDQAQIKLANQKFGCFLINLRLKRGNAEKLIRRIRYLELKPEDRMPIFVLITSEDAGKIEGLKDVIDGAIVLPHDEVAIVERLSGMFEQALTL
jgi:DNA-binding response OmpR family regulator